MASRTMDYGVSRAALRALKVADSAYPDGMVLCYVRDPHSGHGDSLAAFVATEIAECCGDIEDREEALVEALRAMRTAARELSDVVAALEGAVAS